MASDKQQPKIKVTPRQFTITLSENEAHHIVERLKYRQQHLPDLTEDVWKELEKSLGYEVKNSDNDCY